MLVSSLHVRQEKKRGAERSRAEEEAEAAVNKLVRGQTITGDAVRETAAVADTLSKFNYAVENIDGDVNGAEGGIDEIIRRRYVARP